jgi:GMP synthase-like glutamine amidotransferase
VSVSGPAMAMRHRALVIRHVPFEGLGLLGPAFRRRGVRCVRLDVFRGHEVPRVMPPGMMLIVMGGPMSARDVARSKHLTAEIKLIDHALETGVSVLGVCLGAQLLCRAAGGKVVKAPEAEFGWFPVELNAAGRADPVAGTLPPSFTPLHWHADVCEPAAGTRTLASSAAADHQAFVVGRNAYGLQFHPEPNTSMIRAWLRAQRDGLPFDDPTRMNLLRDTPLHCGALPRMCDAFVASFLSQAGINTPPRAGAVGG